MIKRLPQTAPWEIEYGYTRAVVARPWVLVSGQVSVGAEEPEQQARKAFQQALAVAQEAGADQADIVRARIYYTDEADADVIARVHKEVFVGEHPPAATMVRVAGLLLPQAKVDIELDAYCTR
ncbi:Rid family hydrolase [Mycobacteroides chelonae]|uniref:Rid family hydrolase n=1 Tax=Mycobacteroides chelonae TaxID=1774 RepID=UPI0008A94820|nr:Rid family hydrolase [Mycobacteroides chelonae]OHU63627.1 hypothetical protein BKG85_08920 [Mycobacteroides chelonae]